MSYRPLACRTDAQLRASIERHKAWIAADPYSANVDEYHLWFIDALQEELDRRCSGETVDASLRDLQEQLEDE